jgi:hypothetical protein
VNVRRRDTFRIDAHEMVEGRLRVDGHFSRTGTQVYTDGMGGRTIEYRPPEEVFSDDSLSSLRGMSVTVRHPVGVGGQVTPENWRRLAGAGVVVGQTGDNISRSGDGVHTDGPVWVHDAETIRKVRAGELVELSVGYTARLDETPGTVPETGERYDAIQRDIRGNHLALLGTGEARGGASVRLRLDAEGHAIFDDDDDGEPRPKETEGMKFKIRVDGLDYEVEAPDDNVARAIAKERKAHDDAVKALTDERDAATKRADKAEGERDAAKDALAKHPAVIKAAEDERAKLRADAKAVAGCDVTGDSPAAIRKAALVAKGIDVTGRSDDYIEARFDALVDTAPTKTAGDNMRTEIRDDGLPVKLNPDQEALTSLGGF